MLSCALAMDAFAVSLCKSFSVKTLTLRHYFLVGFILVALMPALGFLIGVSFSSFIQKIDHWIAFILLVFIGFKMIKESFEKESYSNDFHFKTMLSLAIATSIDALAVGVSFAFQVSLTLALFLIASITFIFCIIALKIGNCFGTHLKGKAELECANFA